MSYFHRVTRIILPQAFRNALPPTISQLVITMMETSLIVIIGFFDLMASGNAAYGTGEWSFAYVEVYVFIALIYGSSFSACPATAATWSAACGSGLTDRGATP